MCWLEDQAYQTRMERETIIEQPVSSGFLTGIKFDVLTEGDLDKYSVIAIDAINDVTDPKLGLPNLSSQCSSCGAKEIKGCEGHFGVIKFPVDLFHPYFISETVKILNKVCPGCKSIKQDSRTKVRYLTPCADSFDAAYNNKGSKSISEVSAQISHQPLSCKYCARSSTKWYPTMKFKVASRELFGKNTSEIIVEVNGKLPKKFHNKNLSDVLPADYWDFIKTDPELEESCSKPNKRTLSPSQVYYLLKDVDLKFIGEFISRPETLFLTCIPVTPNCTRVVEMPSNEHKLMFDERTKAYRRLMDFKQQANELGSRVRDCLNLSKIHTDKLSTTSSDSASKSGLKWIKDVVLGKRTDHAFRMTVVGDPRIELCEIGIPQDISECLQVSEFLNSRNWEKINMCCNSRLLEKGEFYVRRNGNLVTLRKMDGLQIGDVVCRPLHEGDLVLVNRPPSVHQHSLIALSVKVLPINSVVSINPLICSPLRGDFDGDCLHGYIPQSIDSRVELGELVALNEQLVNGQNGRSLLSLSHDSLTAAYLIRENDVFLNKSKMQQLAMFFPHPFQSPAILKAPALQSPIWTGKQVLSMLLPQCFDYAFPMNGILISKGEILSSSLESAWLQDTDGDIFSCLVKSYGRKALDILFSAQEVLLEWISMRGFSVSLSDMYISSNLYSRRNMMDEVSCGLQEAKQACHIKEVLVDPRMACLLRYGEEHNGSSFGLDHTCNSNKSAVLSKVSIGAFKEVFRDVQNLVYHYANRHNSMLTMVRAGSKGSLLKLVQQGLCLGLQYSSVPLSFKIPSKLSFATWNDVATKDLEQEAHDTSESNIPYAVVENSFLSGLNPSECFIHSLSSRGSSFGENADLPGTLTRKLMFYMRDLSVAYDGTVRNAYGNQVVQFSYGISEVSSVEDNKTCQMMGGITNCSDGFGGQPVGSMAGCSISDTAYSALDQPITTLETSPLLNLKKVLESGLKKTTGCQTISLFLSKKLERWNFGFEYGALEVKSYLERVHFSDVTSTAMIVFSGKNYQTHFSPWVCHFHICKDMMKKRGLNVQSIIHALIRKCNSAEDKKKVHLPRLQISCRDCSIVDAEKENHGTFCITVEAFNGSLTSLDNIQDSVMPFLLGAVIKGFSEVKKVDIIWNDPPKGSKSRRSSFGELYLRVYMSEKCDRVKYWSTLQNACIPIMDLIDWGRSHPDIIHDVFVAYGIDAAWKHFLSILKSATSDVGKTILQKHLLLIADCLSVTGEFVGLTAKGINQQRDLISVSSPFTRACFSNPGPIFIKAAKTGTVDDLLGTLDALAWGKAVPIGTGGHFDILYSGKGLKLNKPVDICNILCSQLPADKVQIRLPDDASNKLAVKSASTYDYPTSKEPRISESVPNSVKSFASGNAILEMCSSLQNILYKYGIDHCLSEADKSILTKALLFHPQGNKKMGTGVEDIKVGYHPKHKESRCFILVRRDGSIEDFSYHKCVIGFAQTISPLWAKRLKMRRNW